MKKTPEEIEKLTDKYFELSHSRLRSVNQKEHERELFIAGFTQCQQDNAERKPFWINLSEKKPNCYETGIWDGKRSGKIFLRDNNGYSFVGVCYQGTMDGSEYCNFYDDNDFDVENITHWAEIPSLN